jgi:anti-anti-sigma factor
LSALTFVDSAGLSVLARRHRDVDVGLLLRGVQPAQMRVFEITGLDDVLTFDGT